MWSGLWNLTDKKWMSGNCVTIKNCSTNSDCGDGKCNSGICNNASGCVKSGNKCFCPQGFGYDSVSNTCVLKSCKDDKSICNKPFMTG
jgi:hypothetical protein